MRLYDNFSVCGMTFTAEAQSSQQWAVGSRQLLTGDCPLLTTLRLCGEKNMRKITHTDLYEAAQEVRRFAEQVWRRFLQKEYLTHTQGATMTKDELITRISVSAGIQRSQALQAMNAVLEAIPEAVAQGDRVELRNFGVFVPAAKAARKGYNPQTGEPLDIPAKRGVRFRPGKAFKEKLNRE